ncbi:MAG: rhomboid family intramembrane serine protease [Eubacteriales bacterium]|nr:rhomboid family intramembrane serine protease [Eubacteriales bacterium]
MNDFYEKLLQELMSMGYVPLKEQKVVFLCKEQEDRILLLRLISERLPGQNPIHYDKEHDFMENVSRKLMISRGKMVESLLVAIHSGNLSDEEMNQLRQYSNAWSLDRRTGRIYIYENQIADFYGLERCLEDYMITWKESQKKERIKEFRSYMTPMNTSILLANLVVFILLSICGDTTNATFIADHGGLMYDLIRESHQYYLFLSSMFIHFGLRHLIENMIMLIVVGSILENHVGRYRYLIIYLFSGFTSGIASYFFNLAYEPNTVTAGASGAIFGVTGSLLVLILSDLFRKEKHYGDTVTIKGMLFVILVAVGSGFMIPNVDNVGHIGGLIGGMLITAFLELIGERIGKL